MYHSERTTAAAAAVGRGGGIIDHRISMATLLILFVQCAGHRAARVDAEKKTRTSIESRHVGPPDE